jgi:HK97 family phage prohead protease
MPTTATFTGNGRQVSFVVSGGNVARDGFLLDLDGLDVTQFRENNPVVLWMHGRGVVGSMPIGRVTSLGRNASGLVADVEFDPNDEFAERVLGKIERGFIRMVSIGWRTLAIEDRDINGVMVPVITRSEMIELSVVAIGSDPDALLIDQAKGPDEERHGNPWGLPDYGDPVQRELIMIRQQLDDITGRRVGTPVGNPLAGPSTTTPALPALPPPTIPAFPVPVGMGTQGVSNVHAHERAIAMQVAHAIAVVIAQEIRSGVLSYLQSYGKA